MAGPILLDDATTGTGSAYNAAGHGHEHAFYIYWKPGVTAGQVVVETAGPQNATQTWANLLTEDYTTDAAGAWVYYTFSCVLLNVRARVTTTVDGGSDPGVYVYYVGNIGG